MKKPKVLFFDIETSHCGALVFGGGKQYVGYKQIKKERKILTIAYSWEGESSVTTLKLNMKLHNGWDLRVYDDDSDKQMLIAFMKEVSKADLVVAHNGRRFDIARLRARLVKYGLEDIDPFLLMDDSYTFCKDIDFTFHKLDYLGKYLGTGSKAEHQIELWYDIMVGATLAIRNKALKTLCIYNRQDVVLLKKTHKKLKPYCKSKLNMAVYYEDVNKCPSCGGKLMANGMKQCGLSKKHYFKCKLCKKQCTNGVNVNKQLKLYPR